MDDHPHDSQDAAVEELKQQLLPLLEAQAERMARLLIECPDETCFGKTQFQLRDLGGDMNREVVERALDARKKSLPPPPKP